jgi:hypothetical protein
MPELIDLTGHSVTLGTCTFPREAIDACVFWRRSSLFRADMDFVPEIIVNNTAWDSISSSDG